MTSNMHELRDRIYHLACGDYSLQDTLWPEIESVENEFTEGSACSLAYHQMLDAYSRLCQRLGSEEWADADVEIIINQLQFIGRHLAMKMFDYGVLYSHSA